LVILKGQKMKLRLPKRQPETPGAEAFLVQFCEALDRSIPGLRTAFILVGLIAAAARTGASADFLFVTGLLFQFGIWFEHWWIAKRTR
jgi:hypothetical protein